MNVRLIKTSSDHKAALKRIDEIFHARPGTAEGDELELLLHLVEAFEAAQYPIAMPDPIDALKFRMEQQGLRQSDLVPYLGNKSKVSEVLNRKRPLSLAMIRKLHNGLGIPADVLVQGPGTGIQVRVTPDTARRPRRAVAESRAKYGSRKP